jgi:hypothetical protein
MRMLLGSESHQNCQNGAVKNQLMTLEGGICGEVTLNLFLRDIEVQP